MAATLSNAQKYRSFVKQFRCLFPMYKEKGRQVFSLRDEIELKVNADIEESLFNYDVEVIPAGILDTFASGVIPFFIGRSANVARWIRIGERWYEMQVKLGESREGLVSTGDITDVKPFTHITENMVKDVLTTFRGEFEQRRPPFDGIKKEIPLVIPNSPEVLPQSRTVVCHEITLKSFRPPLVDLHVHCGPLFNTRRFADDLGAALGTCAHATMIHRYKHGPFTEEHTMQSYAITWDRIRTTSDELFPIWLPYMKSTREQYKDREFTGGRALFR